MHKLHFINITFKENYCYYRLLHSFEEIYLCLLKARKLTTFLAL